MIQNLREFLLFYLNHFYMVDFLFFALLAIVFLFLLVLALILRAYALLSLFFILLDFVICGFLFYYGYNFLDKEMRTRSAEIFSQKIYTNSNLIVDFNISNLSNHDFEFCKVKVSIFKSPKEHENIILQYKNRYLPILSKTKELQDGLSAGEVKLERISFENFNSENNFSAQLKSECF